MRIVLDLQVAQSRNRNGDTGHFSVCLAEALIRQAKHHEVWLLLNEAFPDAGIEIRARFKRLIPECYIQTFDIPSPVAARDQRNLWRTQAAEHVREHYIAKLEPDIVLVLSLFEGYHDDAVVSVGHPELLERTAIILHEPVSLREPDLAVKDKSYRDFYYRKLQSLKNAGLVFTFSELTRTKTVEALALHRDRVINVSQPEERTDAIGTIIRGSNDGCSRLGSDSTDSNELDRNQNLPIHALARRTLEVLEDCHGRLLYNTSSRPVIQLQRPRLAYVSPLPPEQIGIADCSAKLIPELARFYEIELVTDQAEVSDSWLVANFTIRSVEWFESNADDYDRILYHFGNSPFHAYMFGLLERYPGVVALHDFFLGDLLYSILGHNPEAFARMLYQCHGYEAMMKYRQAPVVDVIREYPMNCQVLENAAGVIVYSNFARKLGEKWYGCESTKNWEEVPLLPGAMSRQSNGRADSRRCLGIDEQDFVICSFGLIGPAKLNDRLLNAWLSSKAAKDSRCHLTFVGPLPPAKHVHAVKMKQAIKSSEARSRIHITGFAYAVEYQLWLAAADMAVQLRTHSRGETSKTILDCLASGVPTVFNAHGSAAELPNDVGVKLRDHFDDDELSAAIDCLNNDVDLRERLRSTGISYIRRCYAPERVGQLYRDAIERFASRSERTRERRLLMSLGGINSYVRPDEADLAAVSQTVVQCFFPQPRQLLVDVTSIARHDLKTGIQRVVRAQLKELLTNPPVGYRIEPVYLTCKGGQWHYRYARSYMFGFLKIEECELEDDPVAFKERDVFYSADLCAGTVLEAHSSGIYARYRACGVQLYFMIHDILPCVSPKYFPPGADECHAQWINIIGTYANGLVAVSESVANDLNQWFSKHPVTRPNALRISYVHHGADVPQSVPSTGLPGNAKSVLQRIASKTTFLMVGTIEPRKGHLQVVLAFEQLWERGVDVNLVLVGKEGWMDLPESHRRTIPKIVERIKTHTAPGDRLFWLGGISDEYLEKLYESSNCLIAASEGEGFGLPLIEAAQHELPIIARDIPVFREVAGNHAYYFNSQEAGHLADAVETWLRLYAQEEHPRSKEMPRLTWRQSTERLKGIMLNGEGSVRQAQGEQRPSKSRSLN